jgi:peptidoglycan/LPS O-acetylase OafA/YrhL
MKKYLLAALNVFIDKFQEVFPPNRIVVILTPLAFMPAAGFITAFVAEHFPGLPAFTTLQVAGFFAAGALAALYKASRWLDQWQLNESKAIDLHVAQQSLGPLIEQLLEALSKAAPTDEPGA